MDSYLYKSIKESFVSDCDFLTYTQFVLDALNHKIDDGTILFLIGDNKNFLYKLLQTMFGECCDTCDHNIFTDDKKFHGMFGFIHKRIILCNFDSKQKIISTRFKSLATGEEMIIKKGNNIIKHRPTYKIIIFSNEIPTFDHRNDSITKQCVFINVVDSGYTSNFFEENQGAYMKILIEQSKMIK
jgi:hypothetical protein